MGNRGTGTVRRRVLAASVVLGTTLAATSIALASGGPTAGRSSRPSAATPDGIGSATLAADVEVVHKAEASARALETSPGMPTCAPPALPAATYPPGNAYGVPFLAAITGGEIIAGYDEWTANHHAWRVGSKRYYLDPWQAKVFGITGWVTGLLQLPNLSAVIPARDVVFCDQGGPACESASPPAGQCIHVVLRAPPLAGQAPPPPTTNVPPRGHQCYQARNRCIPYVVTLTPTGTSALTVTGVEPDGSLMLSVSTTAVTSLSLQIPTASESCQNAPTSISLSSQAPTSLPPGAPEPPNPPNPDRRSLRTAPAPLTGPLGSATTTLASNDFSVPAFSPASCPLLAAVFDAPLAGWNALPSKDPASKNNNYYDQSPLPAIAGEPGWVQFSATTTISDLGIPIGPPAGFSLGR